MLVVAGNITGLSRLNRQVWRNCARSQSYRVVPVPCGLGTKIKSTPCQHKETMTRVTHYTSDHRRRSNSTVMKGSKYSRATKFCFVIFHGFILRTLWFWGQKE